MISIEMIDGKTWAEEFSEKAHLSSIGSFRPKEVERVDFALFAKDSDKYILYVQCKEMDSESIYWQLGGGSEETKGKIIVVPAFIKLREWCFDKYKRITMRVENINTRMLHLAMKMGFLITGIYYKDGRIYLDLLNERGV